MLALRERQVELHQLVRGRMVHSPCDRAQLKSHLVHHPWLREVLSWHKCRSPKTGLPSVRIQVIQPPLVVPSKIAPRLRMVPQNLKRPGFDEVAKVQPPQPELVPFRRDGGDVLAPQEEMAVLKRGVA